MFFTPKIQKKIVFVHSEKFHLELALYRRCFCHLLDGAKGAFLKQLKTLSNLCLLGPSVFISSTAALASVRTRSSCHPADFRHLIYYLEKDLNVLKFREKDNVESTLSPFFLINSACYLNFDGIFIHILGTLALSLNLENWEKESIYIRELNSFKVGERFK